MYVLSCFRVFFWKKNEQNRKNCFGEKRFFYFLIPGIDRPDNDGQDKMDKLF
jgi:hypothetical protein